MQSYFRAHPQLGARERGFVAETVYGCLRRKRLAEHILNNPQPSSVERVAVYLAAIQGWSARALLDAGFSGDAAALVTKVRNAPALPETVRADLPDWLYERLVMQLGVEETQQLAAALNQPAPVDLRVNTLKAKREQAAALLAEEGYSAEFTPLSPLGLRRAERAPLFKTRAFKQGWIEVQDEGSQLLALLVEPPRRGMVMDFCAGSGGKTLALGALMTNTGTLYALDTSAKRLEKIKPRLVRAGLDNVRTLVIEHERDRRVQRLRGKIDRVLVDAPCSGAGTLRRNPDIKWRDFDVAAFTSLQARILDAAAELLKPGGRLVYATCSLLREENEDIVTPFLAVHPAFHLVPVNGVLARKGVAAQHSLGTDFLRLYPHRHHTDGFFAAILERGAETA
ncbi:MAG: RsmB/NOP family class I SAM-dependent RNA methyltransferase [Pseudomonadota bacterium]